MVINEFRGNYYFLSNFYEAKIEFENLVYNNAEAAFQAMKCRYYDGRIDFIGITAAKAKSKGRRVKLRSDWESVKDDYMYKIVKAKFMQNDDLRKLLLDTGDDVLQEGNSWGDRYWGICGGQGENKLGKILMLVRNELREV